MIPKGLFTQIGMIIIAVSIIISYVQPAFGEIAKVQDDTEVYIEKRLEVESINAQLDSLVSRMDDVSNDERKKLFTYLPDELDHIAVSRDLILIVKEAGVLYKDVGYSDTPRITAPRSAKDATIYPIAYTFNLKVEGTYDQIKRLFSLIELNNYPFEVHEFNVDRVEGGFLAAEVTLVTYTYNPEGAVNNASF